MPHVLSSTCQQPCTADFSSTPKSRSPACHYQLAPFPIDHSTSHGLLPPSSSSEDLNRLTMCVSHPCGARVWSLTTLRILVARFAFSEPNDTTPLRCQAAPSSKWLPNAYGPWVTLTPAQTPSYRHGLSTQLPPTLVGFSFVPRPSLRVSSPSCLRRCPSRSAHG